MPAVDVNADLFVAEGAGERQLNVDDLKTTATGAATQGTLATRASEATLAAAGLDLDARYGGGKSSVCTTVTASGDTTILTPTAGNRITLYWISALTDPDESSAPVIAVKLGGVELYRGVAFAHWEPFIGPTNGVLAIGLSQASTVVVTAHYTQGV